MNKPELLMPAGSYQKLEYAFNYGADAVYLGVPFFSLRARENELDKDTLKKGIEFARAHGKKVYVTANIFARNRKIKSFESAFAEWMELKPDAFIMSDPGLMMMAREAFPDANLHLSVQANSMNWQNVKFWKQSLNISRVILSRELSLDEIKEIKQRVPDIELEAFVHGSICIAFSGRCLMSSYMSHRDANQGVCDNSCREKYKVFESKEYFAEDRRNPGELYRVDQDEEGTYLFNSKDLCLVEHLDELWKAGVCSFKVEGRTKSLNYVSLVSRVYRKAIDDMAAGRPFDPALLVELEKLANRGYHKGFFRGQPGSEGQNYDTSNPRFFTHKFAGLVLGHLDESGRLPIEIKGPIEIGHTVEMQGPEMENYQFVVQGLINKKGEPVQKANPGQGFFWIQGAKKSIPNAILNVTIDQINS